MSHAPSDPAIQSVEETTCCIVGGGPAGAVLALLLARQDIPVTLLEMHRNFDREFRGDTLHPSVMEIMDQLGLAERLLQLPHTKLHQLTLQAAGESTVLADFSQLPTKFPYITLLPQVRFLEFLMDEAKQYPNFQLLLGANAQELLETADGQVQGVRYRGQGGLHEIWARLTVGADGRFSRLRHLAGFEPIKTSPPMDVLWFRVSRQSSDPEGMGVTGRAGGGRLLAMIDRLDYWQLGYVILKGSYHELREAGIETLREGVRRLAPEFRDRMGELQDWSQVSLLSVEADRLPRWYRPGLLLIGDAAHIMSPVGGVGINYAIQDAVAAANVLTEPLKTGQLETRHLAAVQHQRELPTRLIQLLQTFIQNRLIKGALDTSRPFKPPAFLSLPILRSIPARLIGFGFQRSRLKVGL